jgi:hypothetical protein
VATEGNALDDEDDAKEFNSTKTATVMVPKRASDAASSEIVDEQVQNTIAEIVGDDKKV